MFLTTCSTFKYRIFQYLAAIGSSIAFLSLGMHYGWMSIGLQKLSDGSYDFEMNATEISWLSTMITIGSCFGDLIAYFLINRFGKRNLILWTSVPLTISWILVAAGPSSEYIFIGKFIAGWADGVLFTTVPTFMAEIADPQVRGVLGSSYSVTLVLGMLLMNVLLYTLPMRLASYIGTVFTIPLYLTFPFVPDSPYFFFMKNDPDKAKASLQKYSGKGEVDEDLTRISQAVKNELENEGGILDILTNKTYRSALIIAVALCALNQLTGIMGILMYCSKVFEDSSSIMDPNLSNIIFFVVYFIAVTIAAFVVDHFGRRSLLMVSSCGVLICLLVISTILVLTTYSVVNIGNFQYLQIVMIMVHIAIYSFGLNSCPILVASEVFTPNMKGIGLCITNISFSLSATLVLQYFNWSSGLVGKYLPFYTFAFFALVAFLYSKFYLPETKGKTLEEIQGLLRGDEVPSNIKKGSP